MAGSICKLVLVRGYREAFYQLSAEQRQELMQKAFAVAPSYGATSLLTCYSRWCDEEISNWALVEYPNVEAVQNETADLENMDWFRYVDTQTFLGLPMEPPQKAQFDEPAAVYHLAIIRNLATESMATASEEDQARVLAEVAKSLQECGGKHLILCDIEWSNSESTLFLVQSFPSVEAQQRHIKDCNKLGLYRFVNSREVMGTKVSL